MRPGQAAPVFPAIDSRKDVVRAGFNEAGAGCPGIQLALKESVDAKQQASMRPGQAAPVFLPSARAAARERIASMRPGQAAPVFAAEATSSSTGTAALQ